MKRILVLLSVVALMVVMLAMSVAPAFAFPYYTCTREGSEPVYNVPPKYAQGSPSGYERYGYECTKNPGGLPT
jgi:hypothetical protein